LPIPPKPKGRNDTMGKRELSRAELKLMLATATANTIGATPPRPPADPRVAELKRRMIAAHPDKGGNVAAFISAQARYLDAKRASDLGRLFGL
jgi:hypothetical protein